MTRAMKDSGIEWIGQIPENWNITKIGWNSKFINGYAFKGEDLDIEKEVPVIRIGDIQQGTIDYSNCLKYDQNENLDAYRLKNKDIVIAMSGATTGKTAYLKEAPLAYINQRVGIVRGCSKYCYYCFQVDGFFQYISLLSAGSAQPNISMGQIQGFKIPFISDKEQQKIADYLDKRCEKIDTAIDNQKQIIEKLKEYKQSLITETVTKGLNPNVKLKDSGIEWIGSIPEHWEIKKLKYLFKIKKNIAGKEGFDILSVTQSGIKIKDISTNEGQIAQDYSKYQIVNIDDFIMNHMDLLTGFVDCSHFNGVTSPDYRVFCQIEPTTNSNLYYNYIFQQCYKNKIFYGLGQGVSGLGRWRLPSDMFLNFTLPQPPLSEQKEIAEYLDTKCNQIDEAIKQKEETISKLEEYKKSLIFECVTGKKEVA